MKWTMLKAATGTGATALLLAYGGMAGAHSTGVQSLGVGKTKTDTYTVTCSNEEGGSTPTYRLSARVRDNAPVRAPIVRITVIKGKLTAFAEDTNGDGNTAYSGYARVVGGNGVYTVRVRKSARAAENYVAEFHCEGPASSGYIHTDTLISGPNPNQ